MAWRSAWVFEAARRKGLAGPRPIHFDESQRNTTNLGYTRPTNNAGGLEAGMTNGHALDCPRREETDQHAAQNPLESVI